MALAETIGGGVTAADRRRRAQELARRLALARASRAAAVRVHDRPDPGTETSQRDLSSLGFVGASQAALGRQSRQEQILALARRAREVGTLPRLEGYERPRGEGWVQTMGLDETAVAPVVRVAGNLAKDVEEAARQAGPGAIAAGSAYASDAIAALRGDARDLDESRFYQEVVVPAGQSYAWQYGPLLRGDFDEFSRRLQAHPLGPILDASAVLTGGSAAAVRGAQGLTRAGVRTPAVERVAGAGVPGRRYLTAGEGPDRLEVAQPTSPNPTVRALQGLTRRASTGATGMVERMSGRDLPVVGERARAVRMQTKRTRRWVAGDEARYIEPLLRAEANLRKKPAERTAAILASQFLLPSRERTRISQRVEAVPGEYAKRVERAEALLETTRASIARIADERPEGYETRLRRLREREENLGRQIEVLPRLAEQEVARHQARLDELADIDDDLVRNPTPEMLALIRAGHRVGETSGDVLESLGLLTREAREERPYLHARVASGAEVAHLSPSRSLTDERAREQRLEKQADRAVDRRERNRRKAVDQIDRALAREHDQPRRPRTVEEAQARLTHLRKIYDENVGNWAESLVDVRREQALRNLRARKRKTRLAGIGPSVKKDMIKEVERRISRAIAKHPEDETLQAFARLSDEIRDLEAGLQRARSKGGIFEDLAEGGSLGMTRRDPNEQRIAELEGRREVLAGARGQEGPPDFQPTSGIQGADRARRLTGALGLTRERIAALEARAERTQGEVPPDRPTTVVRGGDTIEEIRADPAFARVVDEIGGAAYMPDLPVREKGGSRASSSSTGQTAAKALAKRNSAILYQTSRNMVEPAAWRDGFVRVLALAHSVARREIAEQVAKPLDTLDDLAENHYYVRVRRGDQRVDWDANLAAFFEETDGPGLERFIDSAFATRSRKQATEWQRTGYKVAQISPGDYRTLFGDFAAPTSGFLRRWDKAHSFWRALTLNWRPAWLVNNVVGQNLLYALNTRPVGGARAYAEAILERSQPPQSRFGLVRAESSVDSPFRPATNAVTRMNHALGELNARVSDDLPRRALLRATVAEREAFINRTLGTNFEAAELFELVSRAPAGMLARVSRKDNDEFTRRLVEVHDDLIEDMGVALVDFANLSQFERAYVRRFAAPFWSWMKGILRATGHIALEHPIKARLVTLLEPVADDAQARGGLKDPIYYLRSLFPLGEKGGKITGLETSAMNPLASATQVPKLAIGLIHPETRSEISESPASTLAPGAQAVLVALTGVDTFSGQQIEGSRLGAFFKKIVEAFPQTRVAESYLSPPDATTSRGEPRLSQPGGLGPATGELLRYLGVPVKTISKEAHERAKREEKLKAMAPPQRANFKVFENRTAAFNEAVKVGLIPKGGRFHEPFRQAFNLRADRYARYATKRDELGRDLTPYDRLEVVARMVAARSGTADNDLRSWLAAWKQASDAEINKRLNEIVRNSLGGAELTRVGQEIRAAGGTWELSDPS